LTFFLSWEKRLPKDGDVRNEVINRLMEQRVPEKATKYRDLRILLVDHLLAKYDIAGAAKSQNMMGLMQFPNCSQGLNMMDRMDFDQGTWYS
jgi:hypothetical protein